MIRRPPRSTLDRSSAASDVYKRQVEAPVGIDAPLPGAEPGQFVVGEELELGDADAVLARDHAVERARQRHDAVSYTHLRAHETVLDPVCRLLLEKKQHHYQTKHKYPKPSHQTTETQNQQSNTKW